ncbi:hypothetical protein CYMTET_56894 [Cymbomonas tetramitiformis]|uniref:C2H2-type domain-containing protein n=1 Tax=Cymbomonas tetramitiformis TaxID=36881 RepID=A0AAE0B9Z6_9CHLO|nr:hypothetical protein CYMTET_56894 [Cymbomonas tetramitiformis]
MEYAVGMRTRRELSERLHEDRYNRADDARTTQDSALRDAFRGLEIRDDVESQPPTPDLTDPRHNPLDLSWTSEFHSMLLRNSEFAQEDAVYNLHGCYVCPLCNGEFVSETALFSHRGGAAGLDAMEPFECSCGRQFCSERALEQHRRMTLHLPIAHAFLSESDWSDSDTESSEDRGCSDYALAQNISRSAEGADCDKACAICLLDFDQGDKLEQLVCKHIYHPGKRPSSMNY